MNSSGPFWTIDFNIIVEYELGHRAETLIDCQVPSTWTGAQNLSYFTERLLKNVY